MRSACVRRVDELLSGSVFRRKQRPTLRRSLLAFYRCNFGLKVDSTQNLVQQAGDGTQRGVAVQQVGYGAE